ncbi:PAS domain S-box-containing protein [Tindallia magadiensis]|uniref:PAS domain S-box-containing protein n=1 Tax=Tindallia magadiensis TaxID=69895 RepID=A0A1I3D9Q8_9FIRM|nr:sigma 54-interacting transcriptional regulator [Tindallia magadiensis]SFH83251.1 PAS domain S-box-containing protein [Tindallia magadiensis]
MDRALQMDRETPDNENFFLTTILDNIYESVCVIDTDGKVLLWNGGAEKLYGIPASQIQGKPINDFFPDSIIDKVRRSRKAVTNQYHSPRKGSHIIANSKPIVINGEFRGAIATDRSLEEVRSLTEELEKAHSKIIFLEKEMKKIKGGFGKVIGKNRDFCQIIEMAEKIAPTNASVMILGESGTGKEVFARGIHEESGRKGLFVPVNCSAIPSELFESEFFGYTEGAFTGASKKGRSGFFELAHEGTLFLDEIGDLPMRMQAKLLRVLQDQKVTRVGSESSVAVNVRIISATNRDLKAMVEANEFREDLFYRLNVVNLTLPPLRDRMDDLSDLITSLTKEISSSNKKIINSIDPSFLRCLHQHSWPGNIRELINVIEYAVVSSSDTVLTEASAPTYIRKLKTSVESFEYPLDLGKAIEALERRNIQKALKASACNKAKAARLLNIPRGTLYHKMKEYQIDCSK